VEDVDPNDGKFELLGSVATRTFNTYIKDIFLCRYVRFHAYI